MPEDTANLSRSARSLVRLMLKDRGADRARTVPLNLPAVEFHTHSKGNNTYLSLTMVCWSFSTVELTSKILRGPRGSLFFCCSHSGKIPLNLNSCKISFFRPRNLFVTNEFLFPSKGFLAHRRSLWGYPSCHNRKSIYNKRILFRKTVKSFEYLNWGELLLIYRIVFSVRDSGSFDSGESSIYDWHRKNQDTYWHIYRRAKMIPLSSGHCDGPFVDSTVRSKDMRVQIATSINYIITDHDIKISWLLSKLHCIT